MTLDQYRRLLVGRVKIYGIENVAKLLEEADFEMRATSVAPADQLLFWRSLEGDLDSAKSESAQVGTADAVLLCGILTEVRAQVVKFAAKLDRDTPQA